MLIILSPAKTMDMSSSPGIPVPEGSVPDYAGEADELAGILKTYSRDELKSLLKVSDALAESAWRAYRDYGTAASPEKQALLAYDGSVFRAVGAKTFGRDDFEYAQSHLRIVSTLYGLVRPLDRIRRYRIAYPLRLKEMPGDLYDYWLPKLTDRLIADARQAGGTVVNLASLDVLGALDMERVRREVRVVTPEFKELRNGKYETVRTYAKTARGDMARWILTGRVEKPEKLKEYAGKGFAYRADLSGENTYVFTRGGK